MTDQQDSAQSEPVACVGSKGECRFNGACMYACDLPVHSVAKQVVAEAAEFGIREPELYAMVVGAIADNWPQRASHPDEARITDAQCDEAIRQSGLWSWAMTEPGNLSRLRGLCRAALASQKGA